MPSNPAIQRTFKETISHYADLREAVFEFVQDEFKAYGIRLSEITRLDAAEADSWGAQWKNPERIASWKWSQLFTEYHSNSGVKRFDIAVKIGGQLQLLCYGVPSRGRLFLKLHAIERAPHRHALRGRVIDIALYAADAYARLIESEEIWLCNPVSPAHVRLYQSAGFEPHFNSQGKVTYLSMRIEK